MIPTNRRRWTVLSIALLGLALAACSSEPGRVAGLSGSPVPAAEAAAPSVLFTVQNDYQSFDQDSQGHDHGW